MIKGIDVILVDTVKTGEDAFGNPTFDEVEITIKNVLVAPTTSDDLPTSINLDGKKNVYTLAIPKGDANVWEDKKVKFFGKEWRTFGFATEGIEANIPLKWNKKVLVERYE